MENETMKQSSHLGAKQIVAQQARRQAVHVDLLL